MPARARRRLSIVLAILLLGGLWGPAALARGPREASAVEPDGPWFMRVPCRDEAIFVRLVSAGLRVLLWWDGQVYLLADAAQRTALASQGLAAQALDRQPSQGDYCVVWEFPAEAEALRLRYGTLAALGDGFYILGLPRGLQLGLDDGPRYAQRLTFSMAAPQPAPQALLSPPPPPPMLGEIVASISEGRLTRDVAALQDDDERPGEDALRSRYTLAPGLDEEAAYIAHELAAAGLDISYFPFTYGRAVKNVIGTLPGLRPESEGVLILCAHYDSTAAASPGWSDGWQGMPAPGADDNASGTAGVLEAARVLAGHSLGYTVRFVFFAGEEQGLQGSEAYAAALQTAGAKLLGVINLDMIGYDSDQDGVMQVHVGLASASQTLGQALVRNIERYAPALRPSVVATYANQASDQATFWRRGYPGILAIEDWGEDFNYNYHKVSDR